MLILTISGVYAEDFDVDSSVMTESPISADLDSSLSSCDALNNDLSNIYEPSDSSDICELSDSYCYESIDEPQINEDIDVKSDVEINCEDADYAQKSLIGDSCNSENLLKSENDNAILAINVSNVQSINEPVFDNILKQSEYISSVQEVYYGILSSSDNKKLLKHFGDENTLLFAHMADWYSVVTREMLEKLADREENFEEVIDISTFTNALLQYYPLTNELYIYKISNHGEDERNNVNDTNSHGLNDTYSKHVDVSYKDIQDLNVLTRYGIVFIEGQSPVGSWDNLDGIREEISSETLLQDHEAIWTPLLLLKQHDSTESDTNGHSDSNKNKNTNTKDDANKSKKTVIDSADHTKNWGNSGNYLSYYHYATDNAVPDISLTNVNNSTGNSNNSTSNATHAIDNKKIESPKTDIKSQPTYTWIFAIIGIVLVSILFNSSYMKRDDEN